MRNTFSLNNNFLGHANGSALFGFFIAFPISYPDPPYYILSFLYLAYLLFFKSFKAYINIYLLLVLVLYVITSLVSSVANVGQVEMSFNPIIGYCITALIIISAIFERDPESFFKGFEIGACVLSIGIIIAFSLKIADGNLISVFISADGRMWGDKYFPDWPNYIALIPVIAALYKYINERCISATVFIFLIASILTTSRIALLGIIFLLIIASLRHKKVAVIFTVGIIMVVLFGNYALFDINSQLVARLAKVSDREILFTSLIDAWRASPIFGWGAVSVFEVASDSRYNSFHNSFLESLVRTGLLGTFTFILILVLMLFSLLNISFFSKQPKVEVFTFFIFVLFASMVQNYLKHPHILFVISILCFSKQVGVCRNEK